MGGRVHGKGDMEADFIPTYNDKSIYKSSDPNNTFWAKDQSRFGLKMLKNMGWSEGRGLGAKKDGSTTHIAINKKNSNAGVGEASASNDNWLKGAFEFNSLLKRLNNKPSEGAESQPKKKLSNNKSKRRHLYQNRLASRDASNYSKEDMALILGTQKMSASTEKKEEEEEEEVFSDSEDESLMLTKQTMSVTDYFLRKGVVKSGKGAREDDQDDADARPSFAAPSHDLTDFCGLGHKRKRESLQPEDSEAEAKALAKKEKKEKKKKDRKERKKKSKSKKKAKAMEEEGSKKAKSSKKSKEKKKSKSSEPETKRRKKSRS